MNIITSLIIGISIILSVFLNNYYSDDRYSSYYVENEEYTNHFVTYVTDKMTGDVERITYKVFKDSKGQIKKVLIGRIDMKSGKEYIRGTYSGDFDPDEYLKEHSKEEDIFDKL